MIDALTLPVFAFVAGLISFSSPCSLPLVPGYLSYVSSLPVVDLEVRAARRVALQAALAFVAGFTLVFTALGAGASLAGSLFLRHQDAVTRWFGVVIIVLGLSTMGVLRVPFIMRERRVDLARLPRGPGGAVVVGMGFAAGWTPCVGPVLATILATSAASETAVWGAALLAMYSVGLGLPFVLLAVGFSGAQRSMGWLRQHGLAIERAGGLLLIAVGVLFLSGRWTGLFRPAQWWFAELGWPPL